MGFDLPADPVKVKHVPKHDTYAKCFELGQQVARALITKCAE